MKNFPSGIKFCFPWRPYQATVLEELEGHLDDNHLNIVAAPGSGKTILGLEVMLRVNHPTLILAPSIAIRNQWMTRFKDHFLQTERLPDWITDDIKNPAFLTVCTYQGLHAAFSNLQEQEIEPEEELKNEEKTKGKISLIKANKLIQKFKAQGLRTMVVDEAHHLRNDWWQSLTYLKENLDRPQIIALTATPPYDVPPHEWTNYQNLCGPIDAEISVPELVLVNNLCPHQDYVYLNSLSKTEDALVKGFRRHVEVFLKELLNDQVFIEKLLNHPCLLEPQRNIETILENSPYFSSIIIFLHSAGATLNEIFIKILAPDKARIPSFSAKWAERLLDYFLHQDVFFAHNHKEFVEAMKRKVKKLGAIEKRNVFLRDNSQIKRLLKESVNKLESILEIVRWEHQSLKTELRMVILTDFIRKENLPQKGEVPQNLTRLGVVPIFEKLRQDFTGSKKIGVLCGSLVIIPKTAQGKLSQMAQKIGLDNVQIKYSKIHSYEDHLKVEIKGVNNQKMVHLITEVFSAGEIEILVGTKSLLGEGWDAPTLNTLILASFVGSFMLSNQMRGRAIRIDKDKPDKVANIWHLATVEKEDPRGGYDFRSLRRRFKAFVGISWQDNLIENGFERLAMDLPTFHGKDLQMASENNQDSIIFGPGWITSKFSESRIRKVNEKTHELAMNRPLVREKWDTILKTGEIKKIIPEVNIRPEFVPKNFIFLNTILALLWQTLGIAGLIIAIGLQNLKNIQDLQTIALVLGGILVIALMVTLPKFIQVIYLFLKHGPIASSLKQIGEALLKSLCKADLIKTDVNKMRVIAEKNDRGMVNCGLEGGTTFEKSIFLNSLQEILDPIDNPRYILSRTSRWKFFNRTDYHAVPQLLGEQKERAVFFWLMWKKYVSSGKLFYTRTLEGRKLLLKARQNAMSTSFQRRSERINVWK